MCELLTILSSIARLVSCFSTVSLLYWAADIELLIQAGELLTILSSIARLVSCFSIGSAAHMDIRRPQTLSHCVKMFQQNIFVSSLGCLPVFFFSFGCFGLFIKSLVSFLSHIFLPRGLLKFFLNE